MRGCNSLKLILARLLEDPMVSLVSLNFILFFKNNDFFDYVKNCIILLE
jgi:hypothetical protein